jgi:uncharacterized protein
VDHPDYDPARPTQPLSDAELEALDDLLRGLPADNPMNVEALDGYLTALCVGPRSLQRLRSRDWMPPIWGGEGAGGTPFASQKQRKRAALLVLRHLHSVDTLLSRATEDWEPVFSVAEDAQGDEHVDAEDWCVGFLQGVALEPAAWAPFFDNPALTDALAPLVLLGSDETLLGEAERARLRDDDTREALSRAVPDAVLSLLPQRR